ncbi:hypothetical protein [Oricola cellulosilytica]|uniref:Uncharacterized protein n=1 Tax=Oricola cellulosilytica TaxID=1429082 RepID=A0A4V2MN43_9HYPH|nr:hypothetical protein [Oricola cellulosilytica]TCD11290.1 hypothetical protein E0D97_17340 [Oricola cellulosilytica]
MASADMHTATTNPEPAERERQPSKSDLVDLEVVELELALDHQLLQEFGFEHCLQEACAATQFDFLFQLPVFDQIPGQRIAVLSTGIDGKLLFAVLNDAGNDVEIVQEKDMRPEITSFALAFMDLFSKLGQPES